MTIEYSLFRVKMVRPRQLSFLDENQTPEQIFKAALREKPSADIGMTRRWHLGNLEFFDASQGYFALGRTTSATVTKFDEETGKFVEEELSDSPFTHCVFDARIGFVGIARKSKIARSSKGLAQKFEQLLQSTEAASQNEVEVIVSPISDPDGFLKSIRRAYRIFRFTATFTGPNPFDADEHFQKPLSVYCNATNAKSGKASVKGDNLDQKVIEEVARSTAATGNKASAQIKKRKNQSPVTISLEGDPMKRTYDESTHDPRRVIEDLSETYQRVRHDD